MIERERETSREEMRTEIVVIRIYKKKFGLEIEKKNISESFIKSYFA
jgi:hypothetical protein